MKTVKKNVTPEPFVLHRQIGSTAYRVKLSFSPDAKETLELLFTEAGRTCLNK